MRPFFSHKLFKFTAEATAESRFNQIKSARVPAKGIQYDKYNLCYCGVFLLIFSGDFLVRGIVTIADKSNLSKVFISTVIIGFGTSLPELLVCLNAVWDGFPEIALGNVIGSNISNILLVIGFTTVIQTIPCKSTKIRRDALIGMTAAFGLAMLSLTGSINRFMGLAMFSSLVAYLTYVVYTEQRHKKYEKERRKQIKIQINQEIIIKKISFTATVLLTIGSLILLIILDQRCGWNCSIFWHIPSSYQVDFGSFWYIVA